MELAVKPPLMAAAGSVIDLLRRSEETRGRERKRAALDAGRAPAREEKKVGVRRGEEGRRRERKRGSESRRESMWRRDEGERGGGSLQRAEARERET